MISVGEAVECMREPVERVGDGLQLLLKRAFAGLLGEWMATGHCCEVDGWAKAACFSPPRFNASKAGVAECERIGVGHASKNVVGR